MTLETFFEKFELFADAPDAVAKMRGLVLHLAFSGKLLPSNEPWPLKPLKSLAVKIGSGATPAGGRESYFTEGIPLIRSMNVHFGGFESKGLVFLSDKQAHQLANVTVQPADVLLNITGASIGRVTTAPPEMTGARVNQHVAIIRPIKELDPRFLAKFLASPAIQWMIDDVQVGATREALTKGMIEQFQIPLPSLAEQKRIVAKVDELMALCDRLEVQQQERETRHAALARASLARFAEAPTPAHLDFLFHQSYAISPADLRKSILSLAVQGKLVLQDPNDEPAEDLVARLEKERTHIAKKQGVRLPKNVPLLTADNYPHDIPESWQWGRIGHLALVVDYGTSQKADNDSSKVPVYRMGNIVGGRLVDENLKYVDAGIDDLPGLYLKTDDILFNRTNSYELVGKSGLYAGPDDTATFASYLIRIRLPSSHLFPAFVSIAMNAPYFRQTQIEPEVVQQCGQANFNGTKLASTVVPIPPLAEQRRIVAKVDELMALVDALETQLATARTSAANLLAAVVAELTTAPAVAKPEAKSNIIQLSTRPEFIRSLLAAEIIDRSRGHESFGQTKFQKIIVLAEYLLELPEIDSRPRRFPRGPHDPDLIRQVEGEMEELEWFQRRSRETGKGWRYVALARAGGHRELFEKQWPQKAAEIRQLIDLMRNWDTERCERFATVYSAWNDLILEKRAATDAAILREVLEKWHPDKTKIEKSKWQDTLAWMRRENLVPRGFGQMTRPPETGELFPH